MNVGDTLGGRFELRASIGQGGMGQVFQATDLTTGRTVAVKCMTSLDPSLAERFALEARVLSSLSHPAIVGYVAHGATEGGPPFLAMEWLDGPDLARVLERGPLGVGPTIALVRRVAQALAAAHQRGIVHRDLKPANILLAGGAPTGATVVDFGIARREGITRGLTGTGAIVGTIGYMAPEQLADAKSVDARVDLFALGCVAYECLTGAPAFGADSVGAVIARIVMGQSSRVRELRPGVPLSLDDLVAALLRTDREQRPPDAAAVLAALDGVVAGETAFNADTLLAAPPARAELRVERHPVAVVLALATRSEEEASAPAARAADAIAKRWGGDVTHLAGGAFLISFTLGSTVQERVARAARAALDLSAALGAWRVSLALAHAESAGGGARSRGVSTPAAHRSPEPASPRADGVELDGNTLAFLGDEFVVERDGESHVLRSFVPHRDEPRKVLGRNAPCLGRDKELRLIESTLDECVDEATPRVLVLRAPPGVGKSKIRREFVARVAEREGLTVLVSRCDVGVQSAALGALRAWTQHAFALAEHPAAERWGVLRERALPLLRRGARPGASAESSLEFFAELVGVDVPEPTVLLVEARTDARAMRQQLQAALVAWLRGASAEGALALVLEDLHWADPSSVSLLVSAWTELGDAPLLLLATAWPEAESLHPSFFALKNAQLIDLAPLGKRASERLARQLLGDETPADVVARVAELADGNAFLLEEIVRHVASGSSLSSLPGSAVAMVQARLAALPSDARRLLRAASVLGERFRADGVRAMGGTSADADGLTAALEHLRQQELVLSAEDLREGGEEWSFRHSLVRQAAYEMLTDDDRRMAHRVAAAWLSTQTGTDPAIVGTHYEQAGDLDAAAPWLVKAMDQLEELGDYAGVLAIAPRIDRDGCDPSVRAYVAFVAMYASIYFGRLDQVERMHERLARSEFERGTPGWAALVASRIWGCVHFGMPGDVRALAAELREADVSPPPAFSNLMTLAILSVSLLHVGMLDDARHAAKLMSAMCGDPSAPRGWGPIRDSFVTWIMAVDDDPAALAQQRGGMRTAIDECSPARQQLVLQSAPALISELGAVAEARACIDANEARLSDGFASADFWLLGRSQLAVLGDPAVDARPLLATQRTPEWRHLDVWIRGNCAASASLAAPTDVALARATVDALEKIADECGPMTFQRCTALARLAACALVAGDPARALSATDAIASFGSVLMPATRTQFHLCRARALAALGRDEEARAEGASARARVLRFAEGLEPADRASWLALRVVADTLALPA